MKENEESGFVIRDRRMQSSGEPLPKPDDKTSTISSKTSQPSDKSRQEEHEPTPPLNFSSFILSLGTSALMLMGEKLSPEQPTQPVNLPQAKEIVDILSLLETKTQGNLTSEEAGVLHEMLYTLRMKYVDAASGKPKTA